MTDEEDERRLSLWDDDMGMARLSISNRSVPVAPLMEIREEDTVSNNVELDSFILVDLWGFCWWMVFVLNTRMGVINFY